MRVKKINKLKVGSGANASRFLVDLKAGSGLVETKQALNSKNFIIESKLEKLAEIDYRGSWLAGKDKMKTAFKNLKILINKLPKNNERLARTKPFNILDELAFVVLFKFIFFSLVRIFSLLNKICYVVGWTAVFIGQFIFLLLGSFLKAAFSRLNKIFAFSELIKNFKSAVLNRAANKIQRPEAQRRVVCEYSDNSPKAGEFKDSRHSEKIKNGPWRLLKPALAFAAALLLLVLPLKAYTYYKTLDQTRGRVLGASESAFNNLIFGGQAASNLNFSLAGGSFAQAGDSFITAQNQLGEINGLIFKIGSLVPNRNIRLAAASKNMIRAGELGASAAKNISQAADSLFNYRPQNSQFALSSLNLYGHKALLNLNALSGELARINYETLPADYQTDFILLKQKIFDLAIGLAEFIDLADKLKSFLGDNSLKRYLLVFQNNAELRASGGFIGSFALVDFLNGKIKKIEAPGGGSYDTEAGLLKKIKAPRPLRLVGADWHFWDANWWPDWPTSARQLAWFYENSDGPTVDGVIGITPAVVEKILKIIGPIDLRDKYGVIINADNFWQVTQEFSEQKPEVTKQPKKIIGDLMEKIINELPDRLNKDNMTALLRAAEESFSEKNILLYFTDENLQAGAERFGWDGSIKETNGDYLSVINTNIAGGKSDRDIKQEIAHEAQIQPDGAIIVNLSIKRSHLAVKYQSFSGVRNVDWLRVYVPPGSKLISARGFKPLDKIFFEEAEDGWLEDPLVKKAEASEQTDESSGTKIYTDLNKTVFANWSQVEPGETTEINLKYVLPFKITDQEFTAEKNLKDLLIDQMPGFLNPESFFTYSLLAQKQPGMNSSTITSRFKIGDEFKPVWNYPDNLNVQEGGWLKSAYFDSDLILAIMLEKKHDIY